jgi:glyoxylase-like metal-dependent hydrolase (beta-lactamase superfamily II)
VPKLRPGTHARWTESAKRSAVLINNDLLIDLGPDIMAATQMHACPLDDVRYCLQTHPHADHLDLSHLLSRSPGFGVVGAPLLEFYASRETTLRTAETFVRDFAGYSLLAPEAEESLNFRIHQVQPPEHFLVGPYSVMAFPANHAPGMGRCCTQSQVTVALFSMIRIRRHYPNRLGGHSASTKCALIL